MVKDPPRDSPADGRKMADTLAGENSPVSWEEPVTFTISPELRARLAALAAAYGMTEDEIVRRALLDFFGAEDG